MIGRKCFDMWGVVSGFHQEVEVKRIIKFDFESPVEISPRSDLTPFEFG